MKRMFYVIGCLLVVAAASWFWKSEAVNPQISEQILETREDQAIKEMTLQSDLIVSGICLNTESQWIEGGRILVTMATIAVGEVVKGEPVETVTVMLPGGSDANRRFPVAMTYPGAPKIVPQEEVFLFLEEAELVADSYMITGFAQGKFSLINDQAGNKLVSRDNVRGEVQHGPGLVRGNRQFVPASVFKNQIRGYLGQ
jgi:hypothetical protein